MIPELEKWIKEYKEAELEGAIRSLTETLLTLYYGDEPKNYKSICLNQRLKNLELCSHCPVDKLRNDLSKKVAHNV